MHVHVHGFTIITILGLKLPKINRRLVRFSIGLRLIVEDKS